MNGQDGNQVVDVAERSAAALEGLESKLAGVQAERAQVATWLERLDAAIVAAQVAVDVGDVGDTAEVDRLVSEHAAMSERIAELDAQAAQMPGRIAAAKKTVLRRSFEADVVRYRELAQADEGLSLAYRKAVLATVVAYAAARKHDAQKAAVEARIRAAGRELGVQFSPFSTVSLPPVQVPLIVGQHGPNAAAEAAALLGLELGGE